MAFNDIEIALVKDTMDKYILRIRPQPEIRDRLDISYKIYDQSVEIFEIRPDMDGKIMHIPIAKTTFIRTNKSWKIFWMRADLKWHGYITPYVKTINEFVEIVDEDENCCFWG
jgi:hypothetical protein